MRARLRRCQQEIFKGFQEDGQDFAAHWAERVRGLGGTPGFSADGAL